jgi:hypothetical protein
MINATMIILPVAFGRAADKHDGGGDLHHARLHGLEGRWRRMGERPGAAIVYSDVLSNRAGAWLQMRAMTPSYSTAARLLLRLPAED